MASSSLNVVSLEFIISVFMFKSGSLSKKESSALLQEIRSTKIIIGLMYFFILNHTKQTLGLRINDGQIIK